MMKLFWGWWGRWDSNPGPPAVWASSGYAPQAGIIAKLDHGPTDIVLLMGSNYPFSLRLVEFSKNEVGGRFLASSTL